jgi:methyl-accepting chemotaxis protein
MFGRLSRTRRQQQAILDIMDSISKGDFSKRLPMKGEFAATFNEALDTLSQRIQLTQALTKSIESDLDMLTEHSKRAKESSQSTARIMEGLSNNASEQTQNVRKSVDMMQEVSAAIQQVAASSQLVNTSAVQTRSTAEQGNQAVEATIRQMNMIHETVQRMLNIAKGLSKRSQQIDEIVNVITGIASQTNLLALNAAIEAARAGEHGRGFSVVADEVRKLAEQSGESAKRISELVCSIRTEVDQVVESVSIGTKEVEAGIASVHVAGQSFKQIQESVSEVTGQIHEVSATVQQMSVGTNNIIEHAEFTWRAQEGGMLKIQKAHEDAQTSLEAIDEISDRVNEMSNRLLELRALIQEFIV